MLEVRTFSRTLLGFVLLAGLTLLPAQAALAYTTGDAVEIDEVGLVHDDLRMGFWHWSHASGDPEPTDTYEGISDVDESVGDHDCNFSTTPYSAWDPIAEDDGASHWPFTFPAGSTTEFVMTAPAPGQYVLAFQALVNLSNNCQIEYKVGGVWTPLNTFGADPSGDLYQTALFAFVVETDANQTQIPIRVINPDFKLSISGVILAEFRGDPFAGRPTSGYTHGNMLFDKTQASALYATFLADPFLNQRYNYCVGRAAVSSLSQFDVAPASKNATGYREELLMNSVLSAINGDATMRALAIELLMKPTNWVEWNQHFGVLYQAGMLRVVATGYDQLYDYMTPAQRDTVRRRLDREAMNLYVQSITQSWWSPDGRANNWQAVAHAGIGFAGLALKDESLRAPQYLDWAKYQTKLYVKTTLSASGACREAYGSYYTYGLGNANAFFVVLKNVTGEDLLGYDNDVIQKTVPYSIYLMDPLMDGFCSFDDAGHQSSTPATVIASMVKYRQDTLAQWLVQNHMGEYSSKSSYPGWRAWEQLFPLFWHDGNVPMGDPETSPRTPLAKAFIEDGPADEGRWGTGHVIMRTGFTSPDDIWFVLQSGDSGGYHGHVDQGSFVMNAYGGHLVTDNNRKYWSREDASHSVVLIDDVGQVKDHFNGNGRMKRDGTVDDFHHDANIGDYALANTELAFDNGGNMVDRSLRHVMFIRKANRQGYFVMVDDVQSSTPGNHDYAWLLHTANWHSVALAGNGTFRINESGDNYYDGGDYQGREAELQVMFATPQSPTMKVVTRENDDPGDAKIIPYVEATQNAERGLFVTLMYPESSRLGIYTPAVTRIDGNDLAGFELNDDLVLFNKAGGPWTYQDVQSDAQMIYLDRSVPGEVSYLVAAATTLSVGGVDIFSAGSATTASGKYSVPVDEDPPTIDAWYSASQHGRGVGEVLLEITDVAADGAPSEPRAGGVSKLVLQFSEPVDPLSFDGGAVEVGGLAPGDVAVNLAGMAVTFQADEGDNTRGEITFSPALPDYARYAVQVSGVTDLAGNALAGDANLIVTVLMGDASGDLRVNVADYSRVRATRTKLIDAGLASVARCDVTRDGRVNTADMSRIRPQMGKDATGISDPTAGPIPYDLTVNGGSGDGSYTPGTVVGISAAAAPAGQVFSQWTGDTSHLAEANDANTTVTMPAANISVTATYVVPAGGTIDILIASTQDDGEQGANGVMSLTSSDLDMTLDGSSSSPQTIGLRFIGLTIPQGATITSAYIQFTADETDSVATSLTIQTQDIDNAPTFPYFGDYNMTSRTRSSASVSWNPPSWTAGSAGPAQQTPNLAAVVQEVVDRGGWSSGNAMVFIITGTGQRVAESYQTSNLSARAQLHVEYE